MAKPFHVCFLGAITVLFHIAITLLVAFFITIYAWTIAIIII